MKTKSILIAIAFSVMSTATASIEIDNTLPDDPIKAPMICNEIGGNAMFMLSGAAYTISGDTITFKAIEPGSAMVLSQTTLKGVYKSDNHSYNVQCKY